MISEGATKAEMNLADSISMPDSEEEPPASGSAQGRGRDPRV